MRVRAGHKLRYNTTILGHGEKAQTSPIPGASVPCWRRQRYSCGVSCAFHSASDFFTVRAVIDLR